MCAHSEMSTHLLLNPWKKTSFKNNRIHNVGTLHFSNLNKAEKKHGLTVHRSKAIVAKKESETYTHYTDKQQNNQADKQTD